MKKEFGVRQVGFFIVKFTVEDNGFYYRKKRYSWNDIVAIKRDDDLFAKLMRCPSSTILLNDGTVIIVPATLTERCLKRETGSHLHWPAKLQYNGFINLFESKAPHCKNTEFIQYLWSGNYVMFYRWLIAMSMIFVTLILTVLFTLEIKLNYSLKLFIFATFWLMTIGVVMFIRRRLNESKILKKLSNSKKVVAG